MLKVIIIDSITESLQTAAEFISRIEGVKLEKTFSTLNAAVKYVNSYPVDVCIAGINCQQEKNLAALAEIESKARLIITSFTPEFAVDAFSLNATDYLIKPLRENRFNEAIEKVKAYYSSVYNSTQPQDYFFIRADYHLVKILFKDILYIEGLDDYLKIHLTTSKVIVARGTLKALSEKLHNRNFVRVHRSFIVPLEKIHKVSRRTLSINDNIIPIGNSYLRSFYSTYPISASA